MNLIRVLHVVESHAKADGGVTTVVNDLTAHLHDLGVYSCVLAATDHDEPTPDGVDFIKMGTRCNAMSALFSSELKASLRTVILDKKINLIHIHGVWMPLQIIASRLAKEMGISFVITSHGMLEPWLWKGKGWLGFVKKKLYFSLVAYPAYQYASSIHAITPDESDSLRQYFPKNKRVTIPNAIDFSNEKQRDTEAKYDQVVFFIGRLNPVKGVDLLLHAFDKAKLPFCWKLIIAGPEEVPEYVEELHEYVKEHELQSQVEFVGSVYGEEKEQWYRRAWVTVVPSYSEVVGMVNLEASVLKCPTITTHATGLRDWEEGGGILVNPDVEELTSVLKSVTTWSEGERQQRGEASSELVKNKYAWGVVGDQWMTLYSDILRDKQE